MASASGSWRGSYIREDDIERLVRLRRIPSSVVTRRRRGRAGGRPGVVFRPHLDRGLGLPASTFFRQFLDNFGLQPHHLPANACILLSCYVAFMEAYAGLWPDIDFWSRLFYLKAQTTEGRLRACGAASIYTRPGTPFPKIPTVDSVKNWQMSFFYVRNEGQLVDRINLPEFNPAPPVGRINWSYNARTTDPDAEVNQLWDFLGAAVGNGLTAEDLLCTIAERRVLPLQMRTHKIGHMSGRFDPNRTSKAPLSKAQVARRVNNITKANLPDEWNYGLAPRSGDHQPQELLLFDRQNDGDGDSDKEPSPSDPADPAGDQAGDDGLLRRDLGGPGEHNRPLPERGRTGGDVRPWANLARAPIKFAQGGGSRQTPRVVSPPLRQRREPTPQPPSRAPTPPPPAGTPPPTGAPSLAVPLASAPDRGTRAEPTRRPTLDDMFPRRTRLLDPAAGAGRGMPPSTGAGAGRAAPPATGAGAGPSVVVLEESPEGAPQAPEVTAPTGPSASPGAPPPPGRELLARQEPARDEPATYGGADSRQPQGRASGSAANVAKVEEASKAVADRRTNLYNRAVTHYHKAMDRPTWLAVEAPPAKVPRLEADLRAARAQCAESEEAGRSAAAKLKVAELELTRLRRLEENHLKELDLLKTTEREKVEDLSRRLTKVEKQRLALQEEVTTKTTEASATAKRPVSARCALDLPSSPFARLRVVPAFVGSNDETLIFAISILG
ncbi:hypothetical protein QYE76_047870 [Lolium multiflorum]|uniref:Transposase (putative) gypsy type domain-containing protein n=1 Tax=Lolium multiflorum TaxID=4521 RepID=A0AAD8TSK1_LOLMU|nr:hypothetical protein QYE76_047870 [Lolium multiflorum]